ncbi:LOW QUALITY PROTEIN: tetratricopeptide repeat protein 22 [Sarcoramphus papa]
MAAITVAPSIPVPQGTSPPRSRQGRQTGRDPATTQPANPILGNKMTLLVLVSSVAPYLLHLLDRILLSQGSEEGKRLPAFNRTLALLQQVIKSSNPHHRALPWCYLGMLLERKQMSSTTPMGIQDCGFSETDPLDCFGKAIDGENPPVLNRLAKIFHFLGKKETAKGICNMALEILRDPQLNWEAYCTQAQIHMKMYLQDLERAKMGQGPVPERRKLMHAKNDLERVLKVCPCLRTNLDMGQSHRETLDTRMGAGIHPRMYTTDMVLRAGWTPCKNCSWWMTLPNKAMEFDLGDTIPELQLFRAKCLWLTSQETLAFECFKQAIELDDAGSTESLRCLLETLLVLFGQKNLKTEMLMQEVEPRVKKAEEKFPWRHLQQELRAVRRHRAPEVIRLCKAMIAWGRTELVKLLFETMKVDSSKGRTSERLLSL